VKFPSAGSIQFGDGSGWRGSGVKISLVDHPLVEMQSIALLGG